MSTVEALLIVVVCLLCGLILLVWKTRIAGGRDVEAAVSKTWIALGLGERIQAVEMHAREIRDSYRSFEQLLRVPIERGSFAELSLETILGDGLPPDMYMIRQRVLDGKVPDASIRSTVGVICIDSKFPLDNYHRMLTADEREMAGFARSFARDVRGHLAKIARDYVQPDKGSAAFAFAYIPSEAVYYYLVNQAYELLREYTRQGVQVVSPLTLGHKLELIKAGA
ncbi:MAG: DNA recombination protein RmuC, partial [Chloroflexi bacterium]|nr:DNA recombination protein RmuC [Chloroflexota bacterium]